MKQTKSISMKSEYIPEIKISVTMDRVTDMKTIRSSSDAASIFNKLFDKDTLLIQEEMVMLCLNRANHVVGFYRVSKGGVAGTVVDPKIIFTVALNSCASAIIIAHNHPSGQLKPSESDKTITRKLKEGGKLLDIEVLDHLIMTDQSYLSFADEGLL